MFNCICAPSVADTSIVCNLQQPPDVQHGVVGQQQQCKGSIMPEPAATAQGITSSSTGTLLSIQQQQQQQRGFISAGDGPCTICVGSSQTCYQCDAESAAKNLARSHTLPYAELGPIHTMYACSEGISASSTPASSSSSTDKLDNMLAGSSGPVSAQLLGKPHSPCLLDHYLVGVPGWTNTLQDHAGLLQCESAAAAAAATVSLDAPASGSGHHSGSAGSSCCCGCSNSTPDAAAQHKQSLQQQQEQQCHQPGHVASTCSVSTKGSCCGAEPSMHNTKAAAAVLKANAAAIVIAASGTAVDGVVHFDGSLSNMQQQQQARYTPQQQHQQPAMQQRVQRSCSWPWLCSSSSNETYHTGQAAAAARVAAKEMPSAASSSSSSSSLLSNAGLATAAAFATIHPAVHAHRQGRLAIAFSGGGFRYTYFIGVMDVLVHQLGLVHTSMLLSGASSGALVAVFTKCGLPVETVLELTTKFSHDCAVHGVKGRLGVVLRKYLEAYLPDDAHQRCNESTYFAVTKVWPTVHTHLVNSFRTRGDLIDSVLASCHLPTLSDGSFTVKFKGRLHIDGGLLSVITPPPGGAHTVMVCSMPSRQIARLPAIIHRPKQSDISISPDTFQAWPYSRAETAAMALQPPSTDFIQYMVARGRADAWAWAVSVGLVAAKRLPRSALMKAKSMGGSA